MWLAEYPVALRVGMVEISARAVDNKARLSMNVIQREESAIVSTSDMFSTFLANLMLTNADVISYRYGELTAALNKRFRNTESREANTLRVGSFGRGTAINGVSDLDMLYILPASLWENYKTAGQMQLLRDVKAAILRRYPTTNVRIDRLVVTVSYTNFHLEVQPVFEQKDQSYLYPDTKGGGNWKTTKPREEIGAIRKMDAAKNSNLRPLCKMARAWRNRHGVGMGGLLIDTLVYNFLASTTEYDSRSFSYYGWLCRDFFKYLSELPAQGEFAAPGSRQRIKVRASFQSKAREAYELSLKAIAGEGEKNVNQEWKRVFGRPFPAAKESVSESVVGGFTDTWDDTEEFIEDKFSVDIRENLTIDCDVSQNGFRTYGLRTMLSERMPLKAKKKLRFYVKELSASEPFDLYWKVLNRGGEARKRNLVRGQIIRDTGNKQKTEPTVFQGPHLVECYCVVNGVVIARDRIDVPIVAGADGDE